MPDRPPPPARDEIGRLGREAYQQHVKPKLRPEDFGKYVAVDAWSGDFEIDDDDYTAGARLAVRCPYEWMWLEQFDYPAAIRFGWFGGSPR